MTNEDFVPIQNEEEMAELEALSRQSNYLKEMINTKGWREVLKPAIDIRLNKLLENFRDATKYEEFITIQQSICAIENILKACSDVIASGEAARQRIAEHNQRELNSGKQ